MGAVVLAADTNGSRQEFAPGPHVVGQVERHRRRALLVDAARRDDGLASGQMWVQPVLLEDVQVPQRLPRRGRLGTRVGLAGARSQASAAHAVTTLDLHEGWLLAGRAAGRPRLHPPPSAALIAVLDRLGEAPPVWQAPGRSAASPRTDRLALGTQQWLRGGPPPVAAPGERLSRRAPLGRRKHPRRQLLLAWPACTGPHAAASSLLPRRSPSSCGGPAAGPWVLTATSPSSRH